MPVYPSAGPKVRTTRMQNSWPKVCSGVFAKAAGPILPERLQPWNLPARCPAGGCLLRCKQPELPVGFTKLDSKWPKQPHRCWAG